MANTIKGNSTRANRVKTRELLERNFPGCNPVVEIMRLGVEERKALDNGEVLSLEEFIEIKTALESGDPKLEKEAKRDYRNAMKKVAASKTFALECFKEVAQYVSPKLKSVEMKDSDPNRRAVIVTPASQQNPVEWEKAAQVNNEVIKEQAKDAMDGSNPETE